MITAIQQIAVNVKDLGAPGPSTATSSGIRHLFDGGPKLHLLRLRGACG